MALPPLVSITATIPAGQALSGSIDASTAAPARLIMPAAWEGYDITFQASADNITFYDLFDADGEEIAIRVVVGTVVPLSNALTTLRGAQYFKIRSGSRFNSRIQSAQRDFIILLEP